MRLLSAIRLSLATDETTSPARQREANQSYADQHGHTLIGEAEDLNVSASKVSPFDRPALGPWLTRSNEYDGIVWWRMDRAVRSITDLARLVGWAREHSKALLFTAGPGGGSLELDLSTVMGEFLAYFLAFAAQIESQSTSDRVTNANAYMRRVGRFGGGRVPFGWRRVPHESGAGFALDIDPATSTVLLRAIDLFLAGKSMNSIARTFADEGIPTPLETIRQADGTPTRHGWTQVALNGLLRSPYLIGEKTYRGRTVRGDDGMPVAFCPPLLTPELWQQLQSELDRRAAGPRDGHREDLSPLHGVIFCGHCEEKLYSSTQQVKGKTVRRYRCATRALRGVDACPGLVILAEPVEQWTADEFLRRVGRMSVMVKAPEPSANVRRDFDAVRDSIRRLVEAQAAGAYEGTTAMTTFVGMMRSLRERETALAAVVDAPRPVEFIDSGRVYADLWNADTDVAAHRRLLLDAGVRVAVRKGQRGGVRHAVDTERLSFALGEFDDPERAELAGIVTE